MRAHLRRCLSCVLWTTKNNECGRFSKERGGGGKRGREGNGEERETERERESMMLAEDNALNTTFRELDLSKQRRKTEKIEISMWKGMIKIQHRQYTRIFF